MDCFYRVSTKVLLMDEETDESEFVVLKNSKGEYELPGGGMEYAESAAESLKREIKEELDLEIDIKNGDLRPIFFDAYKARSHDIWVAFVVYKIFIKNKNLANFEKKTFAKISADQSEGYVPYLRHLTNEQIAVIDTK